MQQITAYDRKDFRKWLQKHHADESKVAVVVHKKHTGKPSPTHRELIEEAICFGWIDTTLRRLDADTYVRHFSKRTKNSRWSDNTLRYARELIAKKMMTPQGTHFYQLGAARPTHDDGIPKNPNMPAELQAALKKDKKASSGFAASAPSYRRALYRWVLRAKLPPTRAKRIAQILQSARAKKSTPLKPSTKANI